MAITKARKKAVARRPAGAKANGKHLPYTDSIRKHLSKVAGVEAVYIEVGRGKVVDVFSVVRDFDSEIYERLIPQETLVEKEHPRVAFDFHVHPRQKKQVHDVIPPTSYLVFKKW